MHEGGMRHTPAAEATFDKAGFLPDAVKLGLQKIAGKGTDGDRSSFDKHCEDGDHVISFGSDRIWGYKV